MNTHTKMVKAPLRGFAYRLTYYVIICIIVLLKGKMDAVCREMGIQAMQVMLKQAMLPVWDDTAMNGATALMGAMAREIPMYHLRCLPDKAAV